MYEAPQLNRKREKLSGNESTQHVSDWSWVVALAQACEQLWNDGGRDFARKHAQQKTDLPALRGALAEGDQLVRTKALHLMSLWNSAEVIGDLSIALQSDPCPVVRHEAAYFLGTTHVPIALDALAYSMLNDDDELVRHESAEAIGELGLAEGFPWLEQARSDPSPLVRRTVEIAENYIHLNLSN